MHQYADALLKRTPHYRMLLKLEDIVVVIFKRNHIKPESTEGMETN